MSQTKKDVENVITKYGSTVTHRVYTIGAQDEWGDYNMATYVDTTVDAVKDNNLTKQMQLQSAGRVVGASATLILKSSVVVNERTSKFIFDGKTHNVMSVQPLEMSGEVLAQLVEVALDNAA